MDKYIYPVVDGSIDSVAVAHMIKKSLAEGRQPELSVSYVSTPYFEFQSTRSPNKPRLHVTGSLIP